MFLFLKKNVVMNRVLWLLSLLCVAGTAMASQGDEDARFKECVAKCMMVPPHALRFVCQCIIGLPEK